MKTIIQSLIFFCFGMHAFNYLIENKTDGQIEILLEYGVELLCGKSARTINKDANIVIKLGSCLAQRITINDQIYDITLPEYSPQNKPRKSARDMTRNYYLLIENKDDPNSKNHYSVTVTILY